MERKSANWHKEKRMKTGKELSPAKRRNYRMVTLNRILALGLVVATPL